MRTICKPRGSQLSDRDPACGGIDVLTAGGTNGDTRQKFLCLLLGSESALLPLVMSGVPIPGTVPATVRRLVGSDARHDGVRRVGCLRPDAHRQPCVRG